MVAALVQSDVPFRDIMRQLEAIYFVPNNKIIWNIISYILFCYFIPENFQTRLVFLHHKSFCSQTIQTQFSQEI